MGTLGASLRPEKKCLNVRRNQNRIHYANPSFLRNFLIVSQGIFVNNAKDDSAGCSVHSEITDMRYPLSINETIFFPSLIFKETLPACIKAFQTLAITPANEQ